MNLINFKPIGFCCLSWVGDLSVLHTISINTRINYVGLLWHTILKQGNIKCAVGTLYF